MGAAIDEQTYWSRGTVAAPEITGVQLVQPLVPVIDTDYIEHDEPFDADMRPVLMDALKLCAISAAKRVEKGLVTCTGSPHPAPPSAACLRCAVMGATGSTAIASVILQLMADNGADEDWNLEEKCKNKQIVSRLRRMAPSVQNMEKMFGEHWHEVLLFTLQIEEADPRMLDQATRTFPVTDVNMTRADPISLRQYYAAYHLAHRSTPPSIIQGGQMVAPLGPPISTDHRNAIAREVAYVAAAITLGFDPVWRSQLADPTL